MVEPVSNPVGRPLKFKSKKALEAAIDAYFASEKMEEWTITGLALALDTTRQTLLDYEDRAEFADTIKKAKLKVENSYERDLKRFGRSGTIFALKNFNWRDKQEIDHRNNGGTFGAAVQELDDTTLTNLAKGGDGGASEAGTS